jgi:hypothetical protein
MGEKLCGTTECKAEKKKSLQLTDKTSQASSVPFTNYISETRAT